MSGVVSQHTEHSQMSAMNPSNLQYKEFHKQRTMLEDASSEAFLTLQEEAAKAVFCQLMDCVEFCHMNGIFHRQAMISSQVLTLLLLIPISRCMVFKEAFASRGHNERAAI